MSIGAMLLIGCVTKVTEYSKEITIKHRIQVTTMTTKPHTRTSNSSVVRFGFWLDIIDFFLQYWGNQIFWALLSKQALRLLTFLCMEVVRVLAFIPIPVFTAS